MTDEERKNAIRERLAAATPGPWEIEVVPPEGAYNGGYNVVTRDGYLVANDTFCAAIDRGGDADLIANAPADLSWALSRIEALEAANAKLTDAVRWALGEEGAFAPAPDDLMDALMAGREALISQRGRIRRPRLYWWRGELREKAFGASPSATESGE